MPTFKVETSNEKETETFARQIGRFLRGGEVIELIGDVGAGKTTFVRGLAEGIETKDIVTSPTFTISQVYNGPKLNLYHFDFYRLGEPGVIEYELDEVLKDTKSAIVIEWGQITEALLPKDRIIIEIKTTSENSRTFSVQYTDKLEYLFKDKQ